MNNKQLTELDLSMLKVPILKDYYRLMGDDKFCTFHQWYGCNFDTESCRVNDKYFKLKRVERKLGRELCRYEQTLIEQELNNS